MSAIAFLCGCDENPYSDLSKTEGLSAPVADNFLRTADSSLNKMIQDGFAGDYSIYFTNTIGEVVLSNEKNWSDVRTILKKISIDNSLSQDNISLFMTSFVGNNKYHCSIAIGPMIETLEPELYEVYLHHEIEHCNEEYYEIDLHKILGVSREQYIKHSGDSLTSEYFETRYADYKEYLREIYADLVATMYLANHNDQLVYALAERRNKLLRDGYDIKHYSTPYLTKLHSVQRPQMSITEIRECALLLLTQMNTAKIFAETFKRG
jgi:hypothetical protein